MQVYLFSINSKKSFNSGSDKFIRYYQATLPVDPFKSCFIFLENNIKSTAN